MHEYMGTVIVQRWWGKPIFKWANHQSILYLFNAENLREAAGILIKIADAFTKEFKRASQPGAENVRFIPGSLNVDPGEEWKARVEPKPVKDPKPGFDPIPTSRLWFYYDLDTERRMDPLKKQDNNNPVTVITDMESKETAYTSGDGNLYTTQDPDSRYYQDPQLVERVSEYWKPNVMVVKTLPDGSIDWKSTIPDLTRLPMTRKWVEEMEKTKSD